VVAAAILLAVSTIWGFFLDPINVNPPIFGTTLLTSGLGSALYGWLQYRSDHYPNGQVVTLSQSVVTLWLRPFCYLMFNQFIHTPNHKEIQNDQNDCYPCR
jgi:hypothetical protein